MKRNQIIMVAVLGILLVTAGWWFLLFSPRKAELAKATTELETAKADETKLNSTLTQRRALVKMEPKLDLRYAQLAAWVPDQPNLPQFINDATTIAKDSGINFVSVSPGTPAQGQAGQGVVQLTIQIKGGFFQLLDYLVRVEKLPRTVVVDSVSISPAPQDDGTVALNISVAARMFMSSVPAYTTVPPNLSLTDTAGTTSTPKTPTAPSTPGPSAPPTKPAQTAAPAPAGNAAAPGRP